MRQDLTCLPTGETQACPQELGYQPSASGEVKHHLPQLPSTVSSTLPAPPTRRPNDERSGPAYCKTQPACSSKLSECLICFTAPRSCNKQRIRTSGSGHTATTDASWAEIVCTQMAINLTLKKKQHQAKEEPLVCGGLRCCSRAGLAGWQSKPEPLCHVAIRSSSSEQRYPPDIVGYTAASSCPPRLTMSWLGGVKEEEKK